MLPLQSMGTQLCVLVRRARTVLAWPDIAVLLVSLWRRWHCEYGSKFGLRADMWWASGALCAALRTAFDDTLLDAYGTVLEGAALLLP